MFLLYDVAASRIATGESGCMRKSWAAVAAVGILVGVASAGNAQNPPDQLLIPARTLPVEVAWRLPEYLFSQTDEAQRVQLQRWMAEFAEWQEWSARWSSRREPGWLTTFRERRPKPEPPVWLAARCEVELDQDSPLVPACALLTAWRNEDPGVQTLQARSVVGSQSEGAPHTMWWERLHLDLMWPALQWQSSIYGVVGMHHAIPVRGRLQLFTTPGVLLLNLPSSNGSRAWKVALNYGIGYRLFEFTFPGSRPAELHLNLAKTWIMSDTADVVTGRSLDVAGLSITFKKTR